MRLYRTAKGRWVRTQAEAGKGAEAVDVEPNKDGIIELLNRHSVISTGDAKHPAYTLGWSDAERGLTTNPYNSPELRAEWEAGYAEAYALGVAPFPSFATQTRGVSRSTGKRKRAA